MGTALSSVQRYRQTPTIQIIETAHAHYVISLNKVMHNVRERLSLLSLDCSKIWRFSEQG